MQLEFPFAEPYIQKALELRQGYMRMLDQLRSFTPEGISMYDIFDPSIQSMMADSGPSIPCTIIVGENNQYDFPFSKPLYQQYWSGFDIQMAVDR